jgi:HRDC domain
MAQDMDIMPYMIANNKGLAELAKLRPSNPEELLKSEFVNFVTVCFINLPFQFLISVKQKWRNLANLC